VHTRLGGRVQHGLAQHGHSIAHLLSGRADALSTRLSLLLCPARSGAASVLLHYPPAAACLCVRQVIAEPDERYEAYCKSSDFIREHIFPGGLAVPP
jgi:hypothetical protein